MKTGKRMISVFLVVLMLLTAAPLVLGVETIDSGSCGDNLTWTLDSEGTLTIDGTGEMWGFYETGDDDAWNGRTDAPWGEYFLVIKTIVIRGGVTSIGAFAFDACYYVTSVTIPDSVTSIGRNAFAQCYGLTAVTIPNSVTSISLCAFQECRNLTSVTIPNSVTSIEADTFAECERLTTVTIPNSITSIGDSAFRLCSSLTTVILPNSVTRISRDTFYYCSNLTNITIPNSVTSIEEGAFFHCSSLTSINISDHVESIGRYAFGGCESLTEIFVDENNNYYSSDQNGCLYNKDQTILIQYPIGCERADFIIPNSVTSIGDYAFYYSSNLTNITISNSVTSIGGGAFCYSSNLTNITIPNSVTTIGSNAFYYSDLTSITIPNGMVSINSSLFRYCYGLKKVTIPNSVTSIDSGAFDGCYGLADIYYCGTEQDWAAITIDYDTNEPLQKATIHYIFPVEIVDSGVCGEDQIWTLDNTGVLTISGTGDMAEFSSLDSPFAGNMDIQTLIIEQGVTTIGADAFAGCSSLESVTIPDSVTTIGGFAFSNCNHLTDIIIPFGVTSIGDGAFAWCSSMTSITVDEANPNYSSDENGCLYNKERTILLQVPAGYTTKNFTVSSSVTGIGSYAFAGCGGIGSISLGTGITQIGASAFSDCSGLTSVSIPHSVTAIGESAFVGCDNLSDVFYCGTAEDWSAINIGENNLPLEKATLHYHNPRKSETENELVAACESAGSYDEVVYCANCGEELNRETVTIPALGHTDDNNDGHCDNCGEQMQGGDHCKFCGKIHNGGFFDKLTGFFHKIFAIFKR